MNAFTKIFGRCTQMKVFDYLVDQEVDVSIKDICDGSGLSRKTVDEAIINLLEVKIVKKTRIIGNTQMYELNDEDALCKKLVDMNNIILQRQEEKLKQAQDQ